MSRLTKECKNKLNSVAFRQLVPGLEGSGMTLHGACPKCGATGKKKGKWVGLWVTDDDVRNKHIIGCNSCGWKTGGGTVNMMMELCDLGFMEACRKIADQTGIQLEFEEEKPPQTVGRQAAAGAHPDKGSFVSRQLEESGLTFDDVKATVIDKDGELQLSPFRKGALDPYTGKIDNLADEMIILYYDLEGRRRMCIPLKNKSREVGYSRVRWSNPEVHKDKNDKPIKYQTIAGANITLYIPECIRRYYKGRTQFDTLFIQEGEKKAEKACKHGLMSIAMEGIGNIGNKEDGLPVDVQYLVQRCGIKNIVMLMDSDWNDLSRNIHYNDSADLRPLSFARALIKFKKYIGTLAQCGIYVDIWFAHINENESGDTGIDDLLCNTLKSREDELKRSIENTMLSHNGKGDYVDIINISSYSDTKIMSLWGLNNKDDFFALHRDRLMKLHSFKFGNVFYKVSEGNIEIATEYGKGEEFWSKYTDEKGKTKIDMDLIHLKSFLVANGFRSHKTESGLRSFVKIDHGVIKHCDKYDIRNFVLDFVNKSTRDHSIQLFFAKNIVSRLSVGNLCQLNLLQTTAGTREHHQQKFYFQNVEITIKHDGIEVGKLVGPVWEDNLLQRTFYREKIFSRFEKDSQGNFIIKLTEAGEECEFLSFLKNTSNFWGRHTKLNQAQTKERDKHLVNKITCLGYLLRDIHYLGESKVVVSMDALMSEVGKSNGRSGKSLIGQATEKYCRQTEINGRNLTNDDPYIFSNVSPTTRIVFIDDINSNFDFSRFHQRVAGKLNVNIKRGGRFVMPFEESPKFYFTTNHALSDLDSSASARLVFMSFSYYYNDSYKPNMEFGHDFFAEWDERQWALFDNLMAECVMIYMRSREMGWASAGQGAIDPPMADLRVRELRQEMGELFLGWAELYFSSDAGHINMWIKKRSMYEAFLQEYGIKSTQLSSKGFRDKIYAYCEFCGLHFNAHKKNKDGQRFQDFYYINPTSTFIGDRDTSGGKEYYTISTTEYNYEGKN